MNGKPGGNGIIFKTLLKGGSTLSMKCGAIGGRAMHEMAFSKETPPYSWLSNPPGRDFNFGHEHPDAGTFIYIPDNGLTI